MSRDDKTYSRVRRQYDAWVEAEAIRPERDRLRRVDPYTYRVPGSSDMSRYVFSAIGIGLGVILLALAGYSFYTASYWAGFGRDGARVGYIVTGIFLLIAGFGGIIATWNHNFRVLVRPPTHG
jgi:hypothetical protein